MVCLTWLIGWQLRRVSTALFNQQTFAAFGLCEAVNHAEAEGRAGWLLDQFQADLRPEALQRLTWHQQRGDRVLLCSASPRMLLQPLADWLGRFAALHAAGAAGGASSFLAAIGLNARGRVDMKLRPVASQAIYALRKTIVEPVFDQIKGARGLDRFRLRGLE